MGGPVFWVDTGSGMTVRTVFLLSPCSLASVLDCQPCLFWGGISWILLLLFFLLPRLAEETENLSTCFLKLWVPSSYNSMEPCSRPPPCPHLDNFNSSTKRAVELLWVNGRSHLHQRWPFKSPPCQQNNRKHMTRMPLWSEDPTPFPECRTCLP